MDHAGKLKEAADAAKAAEATKDELAEKVKKLEMELEEHGKKVSTLKTERDEALRSLAEAQVTVSNKSRDLSTANESIRDLNLKLTTQKETLDVAETRKKTLAENLQKESELVKSAAFEHNDYVRGMEIWTEKLVDVARKLAAQLSTMGSEDYREPLDDKMPHSTTLTMFFDYVLEALEQLDSNRAAHLASESRKLCQAVLRKILTKVVYWNPGINLENVLGHLPKDADLKTAEDLVTPIIDKISQVKRVEGDRRD